MKLRDWLASMAGHIIKYDLNLIPVVGYPGTNDGFSRREYVELYLHLAMIPHIPMRGPHGVDRTL